jgi:hypothetical protein
MTETDGFTGSADQPVTGRICSPRWPHVVDPVTSSAEREVRRGGGARSRVSMNTPCNRDRLAEKVVRHRDRQQCRYITRDQQLWCRFRRGERGMRCMLSGRALTHRHRSPVARRDRARSATMIGKVTTIDASWSPANQASHHRNRFESPARRKLATCNIDYSEQSPCFREALTVLGVWSCCKEMLPARRPRAAGSSSRSRWAAFSGRDGS